MVTDYKSALAFIHGRPRFKKRPTLERMKFFLARLGHPEQGLKYLHITGTNGKGSVVAMTQAMLTSSGLTVGTFTSPFITRFNERIAIDGQPISDTDLVKFVQQVEPVVQALDQELSEGGPTEFEIDLAVAMLYFQASQPDVVILEVGIGGKWDSTNVIVPEVAVIVTVGYDHMAILGDTLTAIAEQKAGIIKKQRPTIVGQLVPEAMAVVKATAEVKKSQLITLGNDFTVENLNPGALFAHIKFNSPDLHNFQAPLNLAGEYQITNAAIAIQLVLTFLKRQHLTVQPSVLKSALAKVTWPGRLEVVNDEPLMLLDGAHNLPGIQALTKTIQDDLSNYDIYLLIGILADKQAELMLGELASLPNVHFYLTQFKGPSAKRPSADLGVLIEQINTRYPVKEVTSWQLGLSQITQDMSANDVIIMTGSLYFISEIRNFLES